MIESGSAERKDLEKVQGYKMSEVLKDHYCYVGSSKTQPDKVLYQCKHCSQDKWGKKNSTGNFRRHLELLHKDQCDEIQAKRQKTLDTPVAVFKQQNTRKTKLAPSNEMQKQFNKYVVEMVALDGLPLSVTKGLGFKRLVEFLKPELNLPSPRSVTRQLEEMATNIALPALCDELLDSPQGGLHFIVDIWTSRSRQPVLGIRVQFVKDWRLRQHTLSFKHIEGRHTGDNIRETFIAELASRRIRESQVGAVVCDNASNMRKAFDMAENFPDDWLQRASDQVDCNGEDSATEQETAAGTPECAEAGTLLCFTRVRCAAHTLQLAVNKALREDEAAQRLITLVGATVNLFRRSCFWTERLRQLCQKDLVSPTGTRWNSLLAALKRLTEGEVFSAVVLLMKQHNDDHPSRTINLAPREFSISRLQSLLKLLKPLADATDRLQGDGTTSTELVLTISGCYAQIDRYRAPEFIGLKKKLLHEINERFEDILRNDYFVVASVLNPRQKLRVFQTSVAPGLKKPTPEEATSIVEALLGEEQAVPTAPCFASPGASHAQLAWDGHDPYAFLDSLSPPRRTSESSELETYLRSSAAPEECLSFWRKNGAAYPRLSQLAAVCFGVPASSGSVERLFSISGALQRARRASLLPKTVQELVLVSEEIRNREELHCRKQGK